MGTCPYKWLISVDHFTLGCRCVSITYWNGISVIQLYMHPILDQESFCMNYCIISVCDRGDQPVINWMMRKPGLHRLHCWFCCLLSSSWLFPTDRRLDLDCSTLLANQAQWWQGPSTIYWYFKQCGYMPGSEISLLYSLSAEFSIKCSEVSRGQLHRLWTLHNSSTPADGMAS